MSRNGEVHPKALRIKAGPLQGETEVQINGQNVERALTGLTLKLGVGDVPTAVLDVLVYDLSAEVDNPRVVVPGKTRELLIQLGWTPPEGDGAS